MRVLTTLSLVRGQPQMSGVDFSVDFLNLDLIDLDAMVYTTPSEYAVRQQPASSSGSGAGSGSSSSASTTSAVSGTNLLLLLLLGALWLGRPCKHWL